MKPFHFTLLLALAFAVVLIITSANVRAPKGSPDFIPASALVLTKAESTMDTTVKIRKASCACGQLTVTTKGPDPERRSLCTCHLCQKQTGSVFGVQARFPREEVTIAGKSNVWKYPGKGGPTVTGRTCADGGTTFHFCPVCGSTVYYLVDADPDRIGVKVGSFADATFPPPIIAGFEEYKFPWSMNVSALPMPGGHHQ
ncbi:MAG TPA: GFA family protein [Chryseolinea sp.]|nr:GFA family protein [Chryseolinea sp.]